MKRLWILNHHSGLDGDRHFELGKEMSKIGVEVTVFMSAFDHQKEEYLYDKPVTIRKIKNGLTYVWLRTVPEYHGNGAKRILNMISYCQLMQKYEKVFYEKFGRPDVVIGSSVHPFSWESAWSIAKKNKIPFVCEIRDFGLYLLQRCIIIHGIILFAFYFPHWSGGPIGEQMPL